MAFALLSVAGTASAAHVVFGALAQVAKPAPFRRVAECASQERFVGAASGSSRPGLWDNSVYPEAVEIMDCLDETHPATNVIVCGAAQLFKTEVGLNFMAHTILDDPCGFIFATSTIGDLREFTGTKFQGMIDDSPALKKRVFGIVEKSAQGSNATSKRFKGGSIAMVTASSSRGLQAKSNRKGWGDEVAEWPLDVGGRGSPVDQMRTRSDAQYNAKFLWTSTPKDLPDCKITQMLEAGDFRVRFHQCPQCTDWTDWRFEDLAEVAGSPHLVCRSCGYPIPEGQKNKLRAHGKWIKTYKVLDDEGQEDSSNPSPPEIIPDAEIERWHKRSSAGRDPSFTFNQIISAFKPWDKLMKEGREAEAGDTAKKKVFSQQKLGRAWNPDTESADAELLHASVGKFTPARGRVPRWACRLTLAVDVQGNRLEWAAWAWGPNDTGARIDWGEIDGDPTRRAVWSKLDTDILPRKWPSDHLIDLAADGVAIDSGGQEGVTPQVYGFVGRRPGLFAMKGDTGIQPQASYLWRAPKVARAKLAGRTVSTNLYFLANGETKSLIASGLRLSIQAADEQEFQAGGLYLTAETSLEHVKQLTAEVFTPSSRPGGRGSWERKAGQANEQLDLARMAFALNWHQTRVWDGERWQREFIARARPADALDAPPMLEMMMAQGEAPPPPVVVPLNPGAALPARPRPKLTKIGGFFDRS
ncbi:COG5525 Phage terminase, large subunit GpA [Caulobacteraceae bacterium]